MSDFVFSGLSLLVDLTALNTAYAPAEERHPNDLTSLEQKDVWYQGMLLESYPPVFLAKSLDECIDGSCEGLTVGVLLGAVTHGLSNKASETIVKYGIRPFEEFSRPLNQGVDAIHHLVEKRFWAQLGFKSAEEAKRRILSVEITLDLHGPRGKGMTTITDALRDAIDHRLSGGATLQEIWQVHRDVYIKFGHTDWAEVIWEAYFKGQGIPFK